MGAVLHVLAGTTRPLSGRELAGLSNSPQSTVRRALQRLTEHGLVSVQEAGAGAAMLYSLYREHVAAEAVLILATLHRRYVERIAAELSEWPIPASHAALFGSAARGDGDSASDIDLFIVRPTGVAAEDPRWRSQLDRLPGLVLRWTGNQAGIAEVSQEDVTRLNQERAQVIVDLQRDAVTLCGPSIRELLGS